MPPIFLVRMHAEHWTSNSQKFPEFIELHMKLQVPISCDFSPEKNVWFKNLFLYIVQLGYFTFNQITY